MRVCILMGTIDRLDHLTIDALTYGDGKVRTYEVGNLDGRIPGNPPLVTTLDDLAIHLRDFPDMPCQVPIFLAKDVLEVCDFAKEES